LRVIGRDADGNYTPGWTPPNFTVDENGKIVGFKEIAALAMDNIAIEVEPFEEPVDHYYPMHSRLIRDLGLSLGEIWHLEKLAESCAGDGRYEFFVAAQPLNVTNGSGAPINPIVIK